MSRTGYREYLSAESRDKGEDRLANLDELITAAHEFDDESSRGSVQEFLAEITLASPIDRWDENTGAVTLMTVHAAKGLEFPVVFIVGLEEGLLAALSGPRGQQRAGGRAAALFRRDHPRAPRALPEPLPRAFVPRSASGHPALDISERAARGADRGPRPFRSRPSRARPLAVQRLAVRRFRANLGHPDRLLNSG